MEAKRKAEEDLIEKDSLQPQKKAKVQDSINETQQVENDFKTNPNMHERNIHKHKPPHFGELAKKYPSFAKL